LRPGQNSETMVMRNRRPVKENARKRCLTKSIVVFSGTNLSGRMTTPDLLDGTRQDGPSLVRRDGDE
jgi:hypothetical protein